MNDPLFERIEHDIKANDVVLYMKGSPMFPQCGFSAAVVQILEHFNLPFKAVDVLQDPEIRQGIKEYSQWPTVPQLYMKGEFIGGCDIVREFAESGEFEQIIRDKGIKTQAV